MTTMGNGRSEDCRWVVTISPTDMHAQKAAKADPETITC